VAAPTPPSGWYPDAHSDRLWRWWDGAAWTPHTAPRRSPVAVDRSRIRPRPWAFALAAIPAALGFGAAALLVIAAISAGSHTIDRLDAALTPFKAPGSVAVSMRPGETGTIYTPAAAGGRAGSTGRDIRCTILGPGGTRVSATVDRDVTLRRGAESYRSLLDFTAPSSGASRVSCLAASGSSRPVPLAIGPRFSVSDVLGVIARGVGAAFAIFLGLAIGTGVGVLVGVLRDRSQKRLQAEATETPPPNTRPGAAQT
jgi:Protein of unknown function (DUF2510)